MPRRSLESPAQTSHGLECLIYHSKSASMLENSRLNVAVSLMLPPYLSVSRLVSWLTPGILHSLLPYKGHS